MTKHLQRDITALRKSILTLGTLVEEVTDKSIKSIRTADDELMADVLAREEKINEMEVDIEEECLKILALHQPVAIDLRFIIVVLKVNNDLERMGDQAVNIIDRIKFLADKPPLPNQIDFMAMGEAARKMVKLSLEALVNQDAELAREVVDMDDELDDLHANTYRIIQEAMMADSSIINTAVSSLTISSNLERIGDLCTNIAEEVIFMEDGEIVRHRIIGDNS
jgi:phosphate transport system protein